MTSLPCLSTLSNLAHIALDPFYRRGHKKKIQIGQRNEKPCPSPPNSNNVSSQQPHPKFAVERETDNAKLATLENMAFAELIVRLDCFNRFMFA